MNADRIVVVEQGKVIEQGSHNELVAANGRYADLWSKQIFLKPQDDVDAAKSLDDTKTLANYSCSERSTTEGGESTTDGINDLSKPKADDENNDTSTPQQQRKEVYSDADPDLAPSEDTDVSS